MSLLNTFKLLIVLTLGYLALRPWIRRRWPEITRKLNIALIAALIAVLLFRLLIWMSGS
jgi:MFS superfamily sulfate permease-like transporter